MVRPSPSSLLPMVLAVPGFASPKPKLPPLRVWCPYTLRSRAPSSPALVLCHSSRPSQPTGGHMVQSSDPAVMDLCLGETGEGAGLPSRGQPQAKYLALNRCPWGKKKNRAPPLDQEKANPPFSQKHKAFCPSGLVCSLPHPSCLTCSQGPEIWKGSCACRAGLAGRGKGGLYKQTYGNIESERREGKRVGGVESGPQKGKQQLVQWLKKQERVLIFFFFNVKYFGGESEVF